MVTLTHTQACPEHVAHADSIDVFNFEGATIMFMIAVADTAFVPDVPDIMREWLANDGTSAFEISFNDDYGTEHVITYAV